MVVFGVIYLSSTKTVPFEDQCETFAIAHLVLSSLEDIRKPNEKFETKIEVLLDNSKMNIGITRISVPIDVPDTMDGLGKFMGFIEDSTLKGNLAARNHEIVHAFIDAQRGMDDEFWRFVVTDNTKEGSSDMTDEIADETRKSVPELVFVSNRSKINDYSFFMAAYTVYGNKDFLKNQIFEAAAKVIGSATYNIEVQNIMYRTGWFDAAGSAMRGPRDDLIKGLYSLSEASAS